MSSDGRRATRRYMLQTLGAVGAVGLAGCTGGNGSAPDSSTEEPESSSDDGGSEQAEEEEEEPDYSLPESEHADITEMATNWMILGDENGTNLQSAAYSPSKLAENYDKAFVEDLPKGFEGYSPFEFSHDDVPETFVQRAVTPWDSYFKIDQLPNNITEEDVASQLQDSGFEKLEQRGDFEIYSDGEIPHAVGEDRHVVVLPGMVASDSSPRNLMRRVIKEGNQNAYQVPDAIEDGIDVLDVNDSLTIENPYAEALSYMPSADSVSIRPEYGISSVDFEEGSKSGAWPFESERKAEKAERILSHEDTELRDGYSSISKQGRVVTANGAEYSIDEMNNDFLRISNPRI